VTRDDAKGAARQNLALRLRPRGAEGVRGATGYNHSIRYKNYLVHIQTEDAGARQAVVATHVFIEGRVIATRRSSYAERLEVADLDAFVRRLVYEQHRSTFVALRDGEFDEALARTTVYPNERTSGVVRRADATLPTLSTSPPGAASRAPSSPSLAPPGQPAFTMVSAVLQALSPPIAPSFQRPITDAPFTGPTSGAWAAGLRLPSTTPPSPAPTPSRPSPTGPLTSEAPAAPSVAPVPPRAPPAKPRPHSLGPSVAPLGPGLRLPSTTPPKPGSLMPPRAPTGLAMPSTVPPSANRSASTLPPALGLRSLLTSMPTVERSAPSPASGRGAATAVAATVNATTTRSEAPRSAHNSPSTAPRPSAPPPTRAFSERPFAPLPLSLRVLEGYCASGVVDLASGKLLAFDGLVGAAALVTSLREVIVGQGRALAALAIEDSAGECLFLGASSCLLVRPLPSRPGAYLYLACDRIAADLGALRAALASAADEIG
jgi:hypothetical protein